MSISPQEVPGARWIQLGGKKKRHGQSTLRGHVLVDEADYDDLSRFNWYLGSDGYAYRNLLFAETGGIRGRKQAMHRRLLGLTSPAQECDHISRDKLDNRRANLRPATSTQNKWNRAKRRDAKSSRHPGISIYSHGGYTRWRARGWLDGREVSIGYFLTEADAIKAREEWATTHYTWD